MENLRALKSAIIALLTIVLLLPISALAYFDYTSSGGAHPAINELAFNKFASEWMPKDPSLKDCSLDNDKTFSGPAWDSDMGIWKLGNREPETRSKTIKDWLRSGGFSADMPEIPKGLRHFYNPLGKVPYLTDFTAEFLLLNSLKTACVAGSAGATAASGPVGGLAVTGVCAAAYGGIKIYINWWEAGDDMNDLLTKGCKGIDAIDWAFRNSENPYTFSDAKVYYKTALGLTDSDKDKQSSNYAKAWRAVGETMHMIADMTVPSHVRNDGHGVSSDPYELYTKASRIMEMGGEPALYPASSSLDYQRKAAGKTLDSFMKDVAIWTNANFFSKDTIPREGSTTMANGDPALPSPVIDKFYTENGKTYYYRYIEGQKIEIADRPWTMMIWKDADPEQDAKVCVAERAILIPTAIQASCAVIDAFLPRFEVAIDKIEDDQSSSMKIVQGHIKLVPNAEWPASSKLVIRNGAYIKVTDKSGKETSFEIPCPDGGSLNDVKWKGKLNDDDKVILEYDLGGYVIRSKPYKSEPLNACSVDVLKLNKIDTGKKNENGVYEVYYTDSNGVKQGPYKSYFDEAKTELSSTGCYLNGKENGHWVYWMKITVGSEYKGKTKMEGDFKDGMKEGRWVEYCSDNQISSERNYIDDRLEGHCVSYWCTTREKMSEDNFKNGEPVGETIRYNEKGIREN